MLVGVSVSRHRKAKTKMVICIIFKAESFQIYCNKRNLKGSFTSAAQILLHCPHTSWWFSIDAAKMIIRVKEGPLAAGSCQSFPQNVSQHDSLTARVQGGVKADQSAFNWIMCSGLSDSYNHMFFKERDTLENNIAIMYLWNVHFY